MQGNAFSTVLWQVSKDPQEASEAWKEDFSFTQKGVNGGSWWRVTSGIFNPTFCLPQKVVKTQGLVAPDEV